MTQMQWQPIETAPKDGRPVLVCRDTDASGAPITGDAFGLFCQVVVWWADEFGGGDWVVYCDLPEEPRLHFEPTHWQPRPEPPSGHAADTIARQWAEIERLRQMAYVPGLWRCPKCNLHLTQKNLNTTDGTVTDRDTPGDRCPNCDVPLWRVSERENGDEIAKRCERLTKERDEARAEVERLRDICKFDCTGYPEMEAEAIKISTEICRAGGADAILVLEAAERLFKAGLKALAAPAKEAGHAE